ncbi:cell division transport system permease protein [Streptomyces sp. SAI-208]|uniref:permease-like cell division protein FtsX n=1 Tax=unclassified Streptomyces TaxID=2593676 RepID=UPI00247626D6|nr:MULTISPECIES: permease-like cell division protein FtsX [unclassified Streptomyces]MDH6518691.1 cell division transport system permease protein [Streptomyces sp. SAI-090]MDH6550912.1 cell division transport system permease protein [Streptomyces sp. SAI-041]MDH6569974.1 cell division transport system permease protein [Streptomyces sp. SAI-117]MDH6609538.1 cell division transport system permease protein [Streptomyces sp. SAI-208]MDH6617214.1 cell division transport system permease protein [Str
MRAQFVLSEIGVGLRRNLTMTFAVIVSVALSLALFGGSLLMSDQVGAMKGYWYDKVNVSIFLCNKSDAESDPNCAKGAVTDDQKKDILSDLKKMSVVETVVHESQDEAYKHYKEQFGDSPLAASLTPDQMQESYRIKLKDPEKYQVIATAFNGRDGVQSVQDQKGILDNLFTMLNLMNRAALGVMALMLIVALLLIVNTVRVSAFSRRRETGIMRLVGASGFYIQAPFIMEAAVAGAIGGGLACVFLVVGRYFTVDHGMALATKLNLINFVGWDAVLTKLPLILAASVLMPALAAFFALRKYLKV